MLIRPLNQELALPLAGFLTRQRQIEKAADARLWLAPDLKEQLLVGLNRILADPDEQVWLALDQAGQIRGALQGRAKTLHQDDIRRTYLSPTYGLLPMGMMAVEPGCWDEILPALWETAADWFDRRKVSQPQAWLNLANQEALAAWEKLGFNNLMDHAVVSLEAYGLPKPANRPGWRFRPASFRDIKHIIPLFLEELEYHADLPGAYWIAPNPDTTRLARREIEMFLGGGPEYVYLLAERVSDGKILGYMSASAAPTGAWNPNAPYIPQDRGILQVAIVTGEFRGQGIGYLLLATLLEWFHHHAIRSVSLSYDLRNPLSGPFWRKHNFRPIRRALVYTF
jgi:GNAT superfamily N-acetyltransferase